MSTALETATREETQTVVAARVLRDSRNVLVGVGRPSVAAILARIVHNPDLTLIYDSGTIGAKPSRVPLSIGDTELAETADLVVGANELFNYWICSGRIEMAFLGAAQIDRFGNLNSTVIGDYEMPRVRLPGAGGAPEIAANCREVTVVAQHSKRSFVEHVDFVSSVGHGDGAGARERMGLLGAGPTAVVTDLGILAPDLATAELVLTHTHEGVDVETVRRNTSWDLRVSEDLCQTSPPSEDELAALRSLIARSAG